MAEQYRQVQFARLAAVERGLEQLPRAPVHQRHQELRVGHRRCDLPGGFDEGIRHLADFAEPAARKQHDHLRRDLQPQLLARRRAVGRRRQHFRQRVPDIGGGNARFVINFLLEREYH